jgi:hypothetical protein
MGVAVAFERSVSVGDEAVASQAQLSEHVQASDTEAADGACAELNRYVNGSMTIDQLHDAQDQLCPALSDSQQDSNWRVPDGPR